MNSAAAVETAYEARLYGITSLTSGPYMDSDELTCGIYVLVGLPRSSSCRLPIRSLAAMAGKLSKGCVVIPQGGQAMKAIAASYLDLAKAAKDAAERNRLIAYATPARGSSSAPC